MICTCQVSLPQALFSMHACMLAKVGAFGMAMWVVSCWLVAVALHTHVALFCMQVLLHPSL